MRKLTRLLAMIFSVMLLCSMTSCGQGGQNTSVTYLYVGNYGGGYGDEFLKKLKEGFEEKYKNYSFEEGKTGVVVTPITNKATMSGGQLVSSLKSQQRETVFFTIDALYYDYIRDGLLYDITDAISEPLSEFGEEKSILDKMDDDAKEYLSVDGKYYAIPFCNTFTGLVYDVDLFEEKGYYFTSTDSTTSFVMNGKDKTQRSAGPDGVSGTSDDGLPATFEQFYALCNRIVAKNDLPFVWTGEYLNYADAFLFSVVSDILGKDEMKLNFSFSGSSETLTGESGAYTITEQNAYMLAKQSGKKDALDFARTIINNTTWYDATRSFSGSFSHTQAQEYFIGSKFDNSLGKRAAMLIEGSYWQNEAAGAFEELVSAYGNDASVENRRFATMPVPKESESELGKRTITTMGNTFCFMNGKCPDNLVEVSKKFIQYAHTDAKLKEFTEITNLPRQYDYDLGDSYDKLTYFGKDLWNLKQSADIISDYRTASIAQRNPASFTISTFWANRSGSDWVFSQFNKNKSYTAEEYVSDMYNYNERLWKTLN